MLSNEVTDSTEVVVELDNNGVDMQDALLRDSSILMDLMCIVKQIFQLTMRQLIPWKGK